MRRLLAFLLLVLLAGAGWVAYELYTPYMGFAGPGVFVDIPKGSSARGIGHLLSGNGVVRNAWAFALLARWRSRRKLQAGEYYFDHAQTPPEIFDTIAAGRIFEISVTIPEGYNRFQIAALLQQNGVADKDAFLEATLDASPIHDLAPGAQSVEGFLFPATYKFPRHAKPGEIVREMTDHFRVEWQSLSMDNPPPDLHTPREIVTLASLVESETPKTSERPVIAGVFLNRLRIGLPLQCDPTVIYALEEQGAYTGSLSLADLRTDSPYNTYRHAGLPPGPIANPGEASLRAALHPDSVDYLYFVADTEGGHFFSRTLAEHNRNVARYRHLMGREDPKPIAPPRPARKKMGHKKKE